MFEESLFCLANLIDAHVKHQDPTLQKLRNSVLSFWGEYLNLRNVNDSGARLCPGCSNLWTKMTTIHFKLIMIWNASTVLCTFIKLAMFYADLGYKHASLTWWPCVHGWGAVNTSTGMVRNERRVACHPYNNKVQRSLTILRENLLNTTTFEDNSYPKGRIVVNVFNRTVNQVHPVYIYIYLLPTPTACSKWQTFNTENEIFFVLEITAFLIIKKITSSNFCWYFLGNSVSKAHRSLQFLWQR